MEEVHYYLFYAGVLIEESVRIPVVSEYSYGTILFSSLTTGKWWILKGNDWIDLPIEEVWPEYRAMMLLLI